MNDGPVCDVPLDVFPGGARPAGHLDGAPAVGRLFDHGAYVSPACGACIDEVLGDRPHRVIRYGWLPIEVPVD
jgi:hypothetical protein